MSLLVVGCNHRSAGIAVLERLAVASDDVPKVLDELTALEHVTEAAVLSTCNRVEIYASVTRFHPGLAELRGWMASRGDVHPQDLDELHYSYHDDRAAAHLFNVAGGLDSMVVGERQVGRQVRQAGEAARVHGAAGRVLQRVFRQAVHVGRRLRAETRLDAGASTMVDVGIDAAQTQMTRELAGSRVAIVGAGKMGALATARLDGADVADVAVWNRDPDKARRLASRLDAPARAVDTIRDAIDDADLVICTTGAPEPVLDAELVSDVIARRGRRPLVLLDLAVPRNVDPACANLDEVHVVDVADVRDLADSSLADDVVAQARRIVEEEAERYVAWTRESRVDPTIRGLRTRAEQVRLEETERLRGRLGELDERQRAAVDALTRGIVNTLLHEPTVRLRSLAEGGGGDVQADALRELFDLDD